MIKCKTIYSVDGKDTYGNIVQCMDKLNIQSKEWEVCSPCPIRETIYMHLKIHVSSNAEGYNLI